MGRMNHRPAASDALVLFGVSGDLAHKMIFPALYAMVRRRVLTVPVVGVASTRWSVAQLRGRVADSLRQSGTVVERRALDRLLSLFRYVSGDYTDPATFTALKVALGKARRPAHYLAIPPGLFATVIEGLGAAGLAGRGRVIVEKPFGRDLASARELNAVARAVFPEDAIFRIDHFLGKETVQNLMVFRFGNPVFESLWNRDRIDSIQISVSEELGVGTRAGYYDQSGALRDMVQNHMLQLLCLIAMEPPNNFKAAEILSRKVDVLHAMRKFTPEEIRTSVVRGQYGKGQIGGKKVCGYRQESKVSKDSSTETFVALKLFVDNWRWQDVPFYLRTGKRLPQQVSDAD